MTTVNVDNVKKRMNRRIAVKTVVFAVWIVGLVVVLLSGNVQGDASFYVTMIVALAAIWGITTLRDVRRLRDEGNLRKAAIAESDERNLLITYKATRLATVIVMCAIPIAICVLAYYGMDEVITALGLVVCGFLVVYLGCWFYLNRTL